METLHDRINRVINTDAFEHVLERHGIDLIDFQCSWSRESGGDFGKLRSEFQEAILAGEDDLSARREIALG